MTEPLVHLRHARQLKRNGGRIVCAPGIRALCDRYGIDWEAFTTTGVPGELFVATGDHFALKTVEKAREEARNGQL